MLLGPRRSKRGATFLFTNKRRNLIYPFVEQIRRHGLDPYAYFEWVFETLMRMKNPTPAELEELLPVNWVATRRTPGAALEQPWSSPGAALDQSDAA